LKTITFEALQLFYWQGVLAQHITAPLYGVLQMTGCQFQCL
jgi:hypothetical protein